MAQAQLFIILLQTIPPCLSQMTPLSHSINCHRQTFYHWTRTEEEMTINEDTKQKRRFELAAYQSWKRNLPTECTTDIAH